MVNCNDFIDIADELLQIRPISQIHLRTIVNRSYYGAFSSALEFATKKGYKKDPKKGTHESLIDFVASQYPKLALDLRKYSQRRITSDYYLGSKFKHTDVQDIKNACEKLLNAFASLI